MSSKTNQMNQSYADSQEKQKMLYKRTLIIISISQIFGGAGLAAGVTVGHFLHNKCLAQMHLLEFHRVYLL